MTRPTVPFLDLKAQIAPLRAEIDAAIADVVDNTAFVLGERLARFERAFADYCGAAHCVGVDSGTQALHLALRALGVGPGDEVITVPNTFIATVEAIVHAGATPVFVDVDPETWLMDPQRVADAVTPRTRAVVPVHLFGHVAPVDAIREAVGDIPVLEDACQAHGARLGDRRAGSLGDIAAFSFYPGKNLGAFGDGGAVVTGDAALADRIRRLRHHGQGAKNIHDEIGFTGRLDALQAVVLEIKLRHLDDWNARRRRVAGWYRERLAGKVEMPVPLPGTEPVHHLFPIRHDDPEGLIARLDEAGIGAGRHYPVPCHRQPALRGIVPPDVAFPVAERLCAGIVTLPIFAEMTQEMVDAVCGVLL